MINSTIAYAYLNPRTGRTKLPTIIGFIVANIPAISLYWIKFKSLISRIFFRKKKRKF